MKPPFSILRSVAALAALSVLGLPARAADFEKPAGEAVVPVQGRLRQAGIVPGALQTIEFRLYAGPDTTTPIWGESIAVLLDTNGVFNVMLREGLGAKLVDAPLSDALRDHAAEPLFLGITPDDNGELAPRTPIRVQGHARHAAYALGATGNFEMPSNTLTCVDFTVGKSGTLDAENAELLGWTTCKSLEVSNPSSIRGDMILQSRYNEVEYGTVHAKGGFTGRGSVPVGTIIAWWGDLGKMPDGWALCDGKDGRPDLNDKFVLNTGTQGASHDGDFTNFYRQGGANSVSLDQRHIPPHTHGLTRIAPQITDTDYKSVATYNDSGDKFWGGSQNLNTVSTGSPKAETLAAPHENRPPFLNLYYIIRTK